jgi:hypothetical protein
MKWSCRVGVLVASILLTAAGAEAPPPSGQNTPPTHDNLINKPNDFAHPEQPWQGIISPNQPNFGQVVRYIQMPARQVMIEVHVPTPEGIPRQTQRQVVTVPGYAVTETTTGFHYPERWAIEQLGVGVYQWRKLPVEFKRKSPR